MKISDPYGGVARQARIPSADGPLCDKAWHLGGEPAKATFILRCADCGVTFARCAQCQNGVGPTVQVSMRAHIFSRHRQNHALKRRVLPREP